MNSSILFLTDNNEVVSSVKEFLSDWERETDTMVTKTSGSTGKPKEIQLQKAYMKASALASGKFFDFQKGQRMRLALSPATIGGKMLLVRGILHGMVLEIVEPSKHPLENITEFIDFISMVPYQFEYILEHCPEQFKKVKTILLGGAPVSENLLKRLKNVPCNVFLGFGMTETMSHIALRNLKVETAFHALDGISFSTDAEQRLIIHAKNLGIDALLTNDIVDLLDETTFIWKGRYDFVINSAGVKIHPEIVEKALSQLISQRFFIIGEEDKTFGEKVVLVIEGEDLNAIDFSSVLSKYEIPKKIYYLQHFVETDSGKVNRLKTKEKIDSSQGHRSI